MSAAQIAIACRRELAEALFRDEGCNIAEIAKELGVHRHTIEADLLVLGIDRFSLISDYDLDELVAEELLDGHLAIGAHALEAKLKDKGYSIQRDRLRLSKIRLGVTNEQPKSIKRLPWFEAGGPDGN